MFHSKWRLLTVRGLVTSLIGLGLALSLSSCGEKAQLLPNAEKSNPAFTQQIYKVTEVSPPQVIQELRQVLENNQPQVAILSPQPNQVLQDNKVTVEFQVQDLPIFQNPDLGLGPHLHVFLDNKSYQAVYDLNEPLVLKDLEPGTHSLRVFASRPWHESFKNEGAYAQTTFHIFTKTGENSPDISQPLLTYSRPQGSYGAEPIMLDFYLTNAPLHLIAQEDSEDDISDWKIRCTINGESFIIDRWLPIYLTGFKPGLNWVQLELLDEKGNPIQNAFNNTARVITYEPNGQDTLSKLVRGEIDINQARVIVDRNYVPTPEVPPTLEPTTETTPSTEVPTETTETTTEVTPIPTPVAPIVAPTTNAIHNAFPAETTTAPTTEVAPIIQPTTEATPAAKVTTETIESTETTETTPEVAPIIEPTTEATPSAKTTTEPTTEITPIVQPTTDPTIIPEPKPTSEISPLVIPEKPVKPEIKETQKTETSPTTNLSDRETKESIETTKSSDSIFGRFLNLFQPRDTSKDKLLLTPTPRIETPTTPIPTPVTPDVAIPQTEKIETPLEENIKKLEQKDTESSSSLPTIAVPEPMESANPEVPAIEPKLEPVETAAEKSITSEEISPDVDTLTLPEVPLTLPGAIVTPTVEPQTTTENQTQIKQTPVEEPTKPEEKETAVPAIIEVAKPEPIVPATPQPKTSAENQTPVEQPTKSEEKETASPIIIEVAKPEPIVPPTYPPNTLVEPETKTKEETKSDEKLPPPTLPEIIEKTPPVLSTPEIEIMTPEIKGVTPVIPIIKATELPEIPDRYLERSQPKDEIAPEVILEN